MGRVERRRRRLGDIGDLGAPDPALLGWLGLRQILAVEHDGAGGDAAARPRISHGGEPDRRFAGAGFADQAEDFAPAQRQVDALDDLGPLLVALALDAKAPYFEKDIALLAAGFGPRPAVFTVSTTVIGLLLLEAARLVQEPVDDRVDSDRQQRDGARRQQRRRIAETMSVALSAAIEPQSADGG